MWDCLNFAYEVPNWTAPNWIALNQTMQYQAKARIAKSYEVCASLRYYVP